MQKPAMERKNMEDYHFESFWMHCLHEKFVLGYSASFTAVFKAQIAV